MLRSRTKTTKKNDHVTVQGLPDSPNIARSSEDEDRYFLSYTFCFYQECENHMVLVELQSFHIVLINYLFSYYNMQKFPLKWWVVCEKASKPRGD